MIKAMWKEVAHRAVQRLLQIDRQRIIQLLESNATGEYKKVMLTPKLIHEIKGEQK